MLVISPCVGVEVRIIIRSIVHDDPVETAFCFRLPLHHLQSSESYKQRLKNLTDEKAKE